MLGVMTVHHVYCKYHLHVGCLHCDYSMWSMVKRIKNQGVAACLHELLNMKPDSDFNRNNLSCQHELSHILLRIIALCPEITLNADRIRTITALMLQLCKETKCITCMWHMALKMSHLCNTSAPKPPPGEYCSFFFITS